MKRLAPILAIAALCVAVAAPTADAKRKTTSQRLAALEKAFKREHKARVRAERALDSKLNATAAVAAGNSLLLSCLSAQSVGATDVLDATTSVFFSSGNTLGVDDTFSWLPVATTALVPFGDSFMALIDPACVNTNGSSARRVFGAGRIRGK